MKVFQTLHIKCNSISYNNRYKTVLILIKKHDPLKSSGKVNESYVSVNIHCPHGTNRQFSSWFCSLSMINLLLLTYTVICYLMHEFSNVNVSPKITNNQN